MKIALVFPPLGYAGRKVASMSLVPPVLHYLAGLVSRYRPDWEIELINANRVDVNPDELNADLVGISILTHQAKWAYRLADSLRSRGVKVIMGGPHPTVMTAEATQHADAVAVGEAESIFETLLDDFEKGQLKPIYHGQLQPLENLPIPRRDILKGYHFASFSTARGCPYSCRFCVTPNLHGRKVRYRPLNEVVADIASHKSRYWFSTDPDIWGPDVDRYIELFKAMSEELPGIGWYGEANLSPVQHPRGEELLKWARRSGLMQVGIGLESLCTENLKTYQSLPKIGKDAERAIKMIRDNGIDVVIFLMLGGIGDNLDSYQEVLEFCDRLKVAAHPVMIVPFPGTELRSIWEEQILYPDNWDMYDGLHMMFKTESGSPEEHNQALMDLWLKLFETPRILKRLTQISRKGFPAAHIASTMFQFAIRSAFKRYVNEYES